MYCLTIIYLYLSNFTYFLTNFVFYTRLLAAYDRKEIVEQVKIFLTYSTISFVSEWSLSVSMRGRRRRTVRVNG